MQTASIIQLMMILILSLCKSLCHRFFFNNKIDLFSLSLKILPSDKLEQLFSDFSLNKAHNHTLRASSKELFPSAHEQFLHRFLSLSIYVLTTN